LKSADETVSQIQTEIVPEAHKALLDLDNLSTTLTDVQAMRWTSGTGSR